jgi:tetratricopeptide (TPR) repeat protein
MTFVRLGLLLALGAGSLTVLGTSSTAAAQTDQGSDGAARTFFDQGRAAYEAGQFEEAARLLRRAYLLSPRFALLYNIGQAELRAGHDALALEAFEGFLRQAPEEDTRRSEVSERVRVLRSLGVTPTTGGTVTTPNATVTTPDATVTTPDATVTTPDATVTTPDTTAVTLATPEVTATTTSTPDMMVAQPHEDSGGSDATPWVIAGVGGGVLVAGVVLVGVGAAQSDATVNEIGLTYPEFQARVSDANTLLGVGIGLTALGVIGTTVGVIWGISSGPSSSASARLHVVPNGLLLEGAF